MRVKGWACVALLALCAACSEPEAEAEMEPDYDNLVMLDDLDDEWASDEERDRKLLVDDKPDPQEQLILEPFDPQRR